MRLPIRLKTLLLLTVFAVAPLVATVALVLPSYGDAVLESSRRRHVNLVSEMAFSIDLRLSGILRDARTVASAIGEATKLEGAHAAAAEPLIKSAVHARGFIDGARMEIPSANIDTVFNKDGADAASVPKSTQAQRDAVDRGGVVFEMIDEIRGAIVTNIPGDHAAPGYVTVPVYLQPVSKHLHDFGDGHQLDESQTRMVIVDHDRRLVASFGDDMRPTTDTSDLEVWTPLEGKPTEDVNITADLEVDGAPVLVTIHTVKSVGWAVALWQPRAVAVRDYTRIKQLLFGIAAGLIVVALLAGAIAARTVTRPVLSLVEETRTIGQRSWEKLSPAMPRKDEIGDLSRAVRQMAEDLQIGEAEIAREAKLRGDLSRFMSQEVVDGIIEGSHPVELGGQRANVTIMFADMVAFTKAAETMPPEQVVMMLNELFTLLTEVVFRHGGIVDKFIGDCVMGIWGAPVDDPDHATKAVEAAEDMMSFLEAGAEKWRDDYGIEVRLAIGINSGSAIVGNIGSDKRMEYTVVGDVVNVAARLESIAAPNQVLVGESTTRLLDDAFDIRLLGERNLTGRSESVQVYELQV